MGGRGGQVVPREAFPFDWHWALTETIMAVISPRGIPAHLIAGGPCLDFRAVLHVHSIVRDGWVR